MTDKKTFSKEELEQKTRQSLLNKMSVPEILQLHRDVIASDSSFEVDSDETFELSKAHIRAMFTLENHLLAIN